MHQVTNNTSSDVSYSILEFSPDGRQLLFAEYNQEGLPEFVVPRYSEKHVTAPKTRRGFSRVRLGVASIDSGVILWLQAHVERFMVGDAAFSPDGKRILLDRFSTDRKHRALFIYEGDSLHPRLVYTEHDSAWIEGGNVACRWSADGSSLLFTSERDGWNHLYGLRTDSTDLHQLTAGSWEIQWFGVHPAGGSVFLTANKGDHAQWQLYRLNTGGGEPERLTSLSGTYESPVMSKNGRVVICSYSDLGVPAELYAIEGTTERRLTYSVPKEFQTVEWVIPDIVRFTARDGATIPALLYKPKERDPDRKYPCVVFVHGAGYLQNVYRGWSYYFREFMFHTYLVQKGYVVFEVDYRGSAGYGRKFRTDVHMHLGGRDLQDELDGVEYLKQLGYIDSTRIGMYGGSYGGFLPLMALFTSPETYACAAVLRAVTNWENYYHHNPWYTAARLGRPEENPEAYKISSPLTFADSLTKPLLILHGMVDDNVFFQDAAQLVDKLQKSGKQFDLMVYPTESHSFTGPESWYDEYRRIDEFFDRHLLERNP
jgi:dipeptidyl aminopeptidase/acylaminoacyl peptidase